MSVADSIALFRILRAYPPDLLFQEVAFFFDARAAVNDEQHEVEEAELCRISRDGCEMVRALLSETTAANEARTNELLAKLRESIEATRLRIPRAVVA